MAPIRVGISGLAATNPTGGRPGIWGVMAHLASLRASPHYEIVVVYNSSIESSQQSIEFHQLGGIKAYGNPKDMASDPDVDLVVCSVNVDKHHMLTTPALIAQKKAFVEWPLVLDTFTHVSGGFYTSTIQSTLKTHYSDITIKDFSTGDIVQEGYKKTSPDHIFIQGSLKSGAVASLAFRRSRGTTDQNCLRWLISGSEGEISVTIPEGQIQAGPAGRKLQLRKGNGAIEDIDFETDEPEHVKSIAFPATNVARIYENFATGHKTGYSDFKAALDSQKLLVQIAKAAGYL
ncbi:hypothetical protein FSARC_258 [Fusarium sarcochroum]|uniref:Gal80p-like C-terminal domain-containing protein n=1 Tax=Fusarium sarcochroum TaxID=1208366 RepID=A0A8H4UCF3_9HYPO|nr:hypothetical protein FSARC_258 [Fusarium sarcochroum]